MSMLFSTCSKRLETRREKNMFLPRMQIAPSGAVMRMDNTARVRISSPIGIHSSLFHLIQLSRNTGPRAAWTNQKIALGFLTNQKTTVTWTVALGIQANAMKIFSLVFRLPHETAKYVPTILTKAQLLFVTKSNYSD